MKMMELIALCTVLYGAWVGGYYKSKDRTIYALILILIGTLLYISALLFGIYEKLN
jgi:sugar phosphate permease